MGSNSRLAEIIKDRAKCGNNSGPLVNGSRIVSGSVIFCHLLGHKLPERGVTCAKLCGWQHSNHRLSLK